MKVIKNKIFTISLFSIFYLQAQEKRTFAESIHYYIDINGTSEQYDEAIDQLFIMLQNQYEDQQVPEETWEELKTEKQAALSQIKLMLASAYRTHFNHNQIKDCITFYESSAAKQYIEDPTQLSVDDRKTIGDFYNSETGHILQEKASILSKECASISENWSSQLYIKMKEKLSEKGYHIN